MNKRLFVAIDPPPEIRELLAGLCSGLPEARWIAPEQLHLTLCFIGDVSGAAFLDVKEALGGIHHRPLLLRLQGVGFFPPRGLPRIIWVGIEHNEPLEVLQRKITARLFSLGLEPENRKFSPHITLVRLHQTPPSRVGKYMEIHGLFSSPEFEIDSFLIYSSVLGRHGAHHRVEQAYVLG